MIIREKTPEKLLVNVDSLRKAILENNSRKKAEAEYENSKNVFLAMLGAFVSCFLSIIPAWGEWELLFIIIVFVLCFIFLFVSLWFLIKMLQALAKLRQTNSQNLEEIIINNVKDEILYTALLIICYQSPKDGEVKFMTEKKGNFLIHCEMNPENDVYEQNDLIINYLATTYNVQKRYVTDILPLSKEPFFSIKPIHGETKQNGFIFFQVKLKKKAKQNLINHLDGSWKSIREMEEQPDLMGRNQDIVMALNENKTKIIDSFGDSYGPLHIIWNITNECAYNCAICATRDSARPEISTNDKLRVLNNIFSAKEKISTLDFAGGDPMYKSEIRTVIIQAINLLGEEHISVTTTGRGIEEAGQTSEDEISKLLRKCEITLDASHENLAEIAKKSPFSRNTPDYSAFNYKQIQDVAENLQTLVINIPLLDDDLSDDEINILVSQLLKLKNENQEVQIEAQIIRLMPVGAFDDNCSDNDKYKNYDPINTAKKIYNSISKIGISCRYHCSLRVLSRLEPCDLHCNMLEKKVGIDCAGNVFACTWGAYLKLPSNYDITQNPFYLGNLVTSDLKNILEGQGTRTNAHKRLSKDISKHTPKHYCEAVSWFFQKKIDNNGDPLSK